MTKCIKMSYKGYEMRVNPSSLQLKLARNISISQPLFGNSRVKENADSPSVIRGSGCITGEDAQQRAFELATLFKGKGSAYLFMPLLAPMKAYFTELKISASSQADRIDYEFAFTEDCSAKQRFRTFSYTYAQKGENLFDISNRTGVSAEKLAEINNLKNLFSVEEGDRIWLLQR